MALWPNNYATAVGWLPYRYVGIQGLNSYTGVGGSRFNRHSTFPRTTSTPEGAAPQGAWAFPRIAGGMSGQSRSTFTTTVNLLSGGAVAGTAAITLTMAGNASLLTVMSGDAPMSFTVPAAQLKSVLGLSGNAAMSLNLNDSSLSIIDPMSGTFTFSMAVAANLKGNLSMIGAFDNLGQVAPDYGGIIHVTSWGTDSNAYPAGTATQPVSTMATALMLAARYNIHEIHFTGIHTLYAPLADMVFVGIGPLDGCELILNNQLLQSVRFERCTIEGKLNVVVVPGDGWQTSIATVEFIGCKLEELEDLQGSLDGCTLDGPTSLFPGGWLTGTNVVMEGDLTVLDMRSTTGTTLSMDIASGWTQIINATAGCLIELNVKGGEVSFDASCDGFAYYLEGTGTLFNDGVNSIRKENHFVWDEPLEYHTDPGSMGVMMGTTAQAIWNTLVADQLLPGSMGEAMAIIKGLSHNNFLLDGASYNSKGVMLGGTVRLFPTAADTTAETNVFKTFTITGTAQTAPNDDKVATFKVTD